MLNVVARTASLLDELVASVQRVFDACDGAIATNSSNSSNSSSSNSNISNSNNSINSKSSSVVNSSSSNGSSCNSQVFLLRASDETVNVTLLARKGTPTQSSPQSQSQSQSQQQQPQSHQHHGRLLASWLAEVNLSHDPLRLEELLSKLQMQSLPT